MNIPTRVTTSIITLAIRLIIIIYDVVSPN